MAVGKMSLSNIANQLDSLQVSGTPAKPTSVPVVNSTVRQAMEQSIPSGKRR